MTTTLWDRVFGTMRAAEPAAPALAVGAGFSVVYATLTGGVANAYKIPSLDAGGLLPVLMFPAGIGQDIVTYPASEALPAS